MNDPLLDEFMRASSEAVRVEAAVARGRFGEYHVTQQEHDAVRDAKQRRVDLAVRMLEKYP